MTGVVIAGTDNDGIVLSSPATDDPATVTASGYVTNNTAIHNYDAIYGAPGYAWTVTNLGTIAGGTPIGADDGSPRPDVGVHLTAGGVVTNGQSGSSTGSIRGSRAGVDMEGGSGSVTNFGTIESSGYDFTAGVSLWAGGSVTNGESGSAGGLIVGGMGVYIESGIGTVVNFGTIAGVSGGEIMSGYANGVSLFQGSVTNNESGLITGYDTGVLISHGSVENLGTIEGSIGVDFYGTLPSTLENAGTINGNAGTAVRFGGGDDRLIVDPGAVFVGTVDGSGGNDVLELAAGTGNTTLSGLGTNFTNFETVVFDANVDWRVTVDTTFTGTIWGFGAGDILDLTGKAATGVTYAGGVLTVQNGGTVVAMFNLTGSYTSADFSVSSDGHGGTDIGIAAAPPANTPPVVTPTSANLTATKGQSFAASALFTASDADGDTITQYDFWDTGGGGGHFVVDGVKQPTNQDIYVSASQLAKTTYRSGTGTDTLWVRATDGMEWSAWSSSFTVTASDRPPVVTPTSANITARKGQSFAASSLFTANDPDGDAITRYDFRDTGGGGGYFLVNGVKQPTNQDIYVSASQLAKTTYRSGTGTDTLSVRANDGAQWSDWSSSFTVTVVGNT